MHSHIWLQVIVFCFGPIALHGLMDFLRTTAPLLAKIVYAYSHLYTVVYSYSTLY